MKLTKKLLIKVQSKMKIYKFWKNLRFLIRKKSRLKTMKLFFLV